MESLTIRHAAVGDAQDLADLSAQLGYPTSIAQSENRLGTVLGSSDHLVLVACLANGMVIGWVHVFLALRIESDPFAELGGFVVAESHRGIGVGKRMLADAEEWVNARQIAKLRVRSRSDRSDARAFYERLGFTKTKQQNVFDKPVNTST